MNHAVAVAVGESGQQTLHDAADLGPVDPHIAVEH